MLNKQLKRIAIGTTKRGDPYVQGLCEDGTRINVFKNQPHYDMLFSKIEQLLSPSTQAISFVDSIPIRVTEDGEWYKLYDLTPGVAQTVIENPPDSAIQQSVQWARAIIKNDNAVIFDVETSSFDEEGEIVWIAACDMQGNMLLDQLIRPVKMDKLTTFDPKRGCTPAEYHGVTPQRLRNCQLFCNLWDVVIYDILDSNDTVGWNIAFDEACLERECTRQGEVHLAPHQTHDAMKHYGAYRGVWNPLYGEWKYFKLGEAIEHEGLSMLKAHEPLADCRMTLAIIQAMAGAAVGIPSREL